VGREQLSVEGTGMTVKAAASPILQLIRRVVEDPQVRDLSDRDLLQRFRSQHDEVAFHALLGRHGAMVVDVCRGVLGDGPDADDAFQATFLVLAQKAGSIRKGASLGSWLHGVARRTALKARAQSAARQKHEARAPQRPAAEVDNLSWREVRRVLHEELGGLPERYREPLVICYLEGATQQRAAARLGLAERTLRERLERGRELLRLRLVRRGLGPVAVLAVAAWPAAAVSAPVPAALVHSTVKAATQIAAGQAAAAVVSANVAALTEGVLKTMFLSKLKVAAAGMVLAALVVGGVLTAGLSAVPQHSLAQQLVAGQSETPADKEPAKKAPDAGPDGVKVVKTGAETMLSPVYCNDGKTVAGLLARDGPENGSVVLWDLQKGEVQQTLEKFDTTSLRYCHVTASQDGTTIAASAITGTEAQLQRRKGTIKVWEAKTGKLLGTFERPGEVHWGIALSADGKKLAGGNWSSDDNTVCVWDVRSGKVLAELEAGGMEYPSVALSADGRWVAGGGKNKAVVWDLQTGKVKHELSDPEMMGEVRYVALSPDGKRLAVGGTQDKRVRVWNVETGKREHLLDGHSIFMLAFSPDGQTLAASGTDGRVVLWNVAAGKALATLQMPGRGGKESDVNGGDDKKGEEKLKLYMFVGGFSPDGRTLATSCLDGTMRLWPVPASGPGRKP
jgi:RNA polymerase sigma factor (sigma-70 family)